MWTLKQLIQELPDFQYETLKYIVHHLRKIADNADKNKMETKNLAIVFGPTLVRTGEENMVSMVKDMSDQCRIVETLIQHSEWFFDDEGKDTAFYEESGAKQPPIPSDSSSMEVISQNMLTSLGQIAETMTGSADSLHKAKISVNIPLPRGRQGVRGYENKRLDGGSSIESGVADLAGSEKNSPVFDKHLWNKIPIDITPGSPQQERQEVPLIRRQNSEPHMSLAIAHDDSDQKYRSEGEEDELNTHRPRSTALKAYSYAHPPPPSYHKGRTVGQMRREAPQSPTLKDLSPSDHESSSPFGQEVEVKLTLEPKGTNKPDFVSLSEKTKLRLIKATLEQQKSQDWKKEDAGSPHQEMTESADIPASQNTSCSSSAVSSAVSSKASSVDSLNLTYLSELPVEHRKISAPERTLSSSPIMVPMGSGSRSPSLDSRLEKSHQSNITTRELSGRLPGKDLHSSPSVGRRSPVDRKAPASPLFEGGRVNKDNRQPSSLPPSPGVHSRGFHLPLQASLSQESSKSCDASSLHDVHAQASPEVQRKVSPSSPHHIWNTGSSPRNIRKSSREGNAKSELVLELKKDKSNTEIVSKETVFSGRGSSRKNSHEEQNAPESSREIGHSNRSSYTLQDVTSEKQPPSNNSKHPSHVHRDHSSKHPPKRSSLQEKKNSQVLPVHKAGSNARANGRNASTSSDDKETRTSVTSLSDSSDSSGDEEYALSMSTSFDEKLRILLDLDQTLDNKKLQRARKSEDSNPSDKENNTIADTTELNAKQVPSQENMQPQASTARPVSPRTIQSLLEKTSCANIPMIRVESKKVDNMPQEQLAFSSKRDYGRPLDARRSKLGNTQEQSQSKIGNVRTTTPIELREFKTGAGERVKKLNKTAQDPKNAESKPLHGVGGSGSSNKTTNLSKKPPLPKGVLARPDVHEWMASRFPKRQQEVLLKPKGHQGQQSGNKGVNELKRPTLKERPSRELLTQRLDRNAQHIAELLEEMHTERLMKRQKSDISGESQRAAAQRARERRRRHSAGEDDEIALLAERLRTESNEEFIDRSILLETKNRMEKKGQATSTGEKTPSNGRGNDTRRSDTTKESQVGRKEVKQRSISQSSDLSDSYRKGDWVKGRKPSTHAKSEIT